MSIIDELDATREAAEDAAWAYQDQVCQALKDLCPTLDWVVRTEADDNDLCLKIWLRETDDQVEVTTRTVFGMEGKSLFTDVDDPHVQAHLRSATKDWPLFCRILAHWRAADSGTELDLTTT